MVHGELYIYFFEHREILSNGVAVNAVVFYLGKIQSLSRTMFIMEVQTSCKRGEAHPILRSLFSKTE